MSKLSTPLYPWRPVLAVAMTVAMTACGGDSLPIGTVGHVKGFAGAVAGDEPASVLAARNVLSAGGNAVDAATTLYFALAVTLPSKASLGGGGTCVVHDRDKKATEVLRFRAPPVARQGQVAMAVPANARGFFALWARYGSMRWESLLIEPERMARSGVPVSRTLAYDLAIAAPRMANDPEAQRLFFGDDGRVLEEGERLQNLELGSMIAWLRRSPGEFFAGSLSHQMAAAAARAGGGLTFEDLRDVRPSFATGASIPVGDDVAVLPQVRGDGGTVVAALSRRHSGERPQLAAAQPDANASPPGTGFVVIDSHGTAVACGVSANGLFGNGRVAPGTGIVLAAPPEGDAVGAVPMLLVNQNNQELHFAGVAGGGGSPAAALAKTLLAVVDKGEPVERAVASGGNATASRINALACGGGGPDFSNCAVATDPRGFGYAVVVGRE